MKKLSLFLLLMALATTSGAQDKTQGTKAPKAAKASSAKNSKQPAIKFNETGLPYLGCMVKNSQGGFKEDTLCQCRQNKKNPCATASVNFDKARYEAYNKYLGDKAAFDRETINLMEQVAVTVKEISDHYYRGEKSFPETTKKEKKLAQLNAQLKHKLDTSPQAAKQSKNKGPENAKLAELKIQYLNKLAQVSNHPEVKNNQSLHRSITQALNAPARQTAAQVIVQQTLQDPLPAPGEGPTPFNLMGLSPKDARKVLSQIEKTNSLVAQEDDDLFVRITKSYHKVGISKLIDTEALLQEDLKKEPRGKKSASKKHATIK